MHANTVFYLKNCLYHWIIIICVSRKLKNIVCAVRKKIIKKLCITLKQWGEGLNTQTLPDYATEPIKWRFFRYLYIYIYNHWNSNHWIVRIVQNKRRIENHIGSYNNSVMKSNGIKSIWALKLEIERFEMITFYNVFNWTEMVDLVDTQRTAHKNRIQNRC